MTAYSRNYKFNSNDGMQIHLIFGFVVRFIMIIYGEHHDRNNSLKYTDIDYHVITDGAREVSEGGSPFDRHTYRYTPFLAWLMLLNVKGHFLLGKVLFSLCDCVSANLIYKILVSEGHPKSFSIKCSLIWLYNPISIGISSRGSAESVVAILVLVTVYLLKQRLPLLTGFFLGLSIHFKIYPIIYCLPIYLSFSTDQELKILWKRFLPTLAKIKVVIGVLIGFFVPTAFGYKLYGFDYIEESFIYHIVRSDTRHNFSVYFYLLYLSADYEIPGLFLSTFTPQCILLLIIGVRFGQRLDISFALFAQTVVFVTFNKVVTSQYFVWYLLLLPLIIPRLNISLKKGIFFISLWLAAQCSWLLPAYLLEFHAINAFVPIWLEGIAFFCCNVGILISLILNYIPGQIHYHHSTRKNR